VFEELELKRRVLAAAEAVMAPDAVFASNTSALPIGDIAARARHPERVLGMHYFSPVPKMPLLELVVTPRTSDEAVATARAFGVRQGKTVIVVRDGPGFYTSRILSPYLAEATTLVREGAPVEQVDRELKDFGFPVGPLALLDEVGIDVAAHVSTNFGALYAARGLGATDAFRVLHQAGASGRKAGRGFYTYERRRRGPRPVNAGVYDLLGAAPRRGLPPGVIAERTAYLMVNEAAYCLDEGVIGSPRDGDVGAILGLGFPPFRGGPFRWLDAEGIATFVARIERLAAEHGPRFAPAPLLRRMAASAECFYAEPAPVG
jgi:3-hydroxyacyl-CoA dehydrogenase/enoyl-CoA hydratase/3-hydroxybutyryl-CoA epimerase